jgi:hypothetical protein
VFVARDTKQFAFLFRLKLVAISFAAREDETLTGVCLVVVPVSRESTSTLSLFLFLLTDLLNKSHVYDLQLLELTFRIGALETIARQHIAFLLFDQIDCRTLLDVLSVEEKSSADTDAIVARSTARTPLAPSSRLTQRIRLYRTVRSIVS